jgi:ribosomal protein S3AE
LELNDIFRNGSVVSLSASIWRARTKIVPQDLEIPDSAEVRRVLALGSHRLAPMEAFKDIHLAEREARLLLEANSLSFRMIPGARYVPDDRLPQVITDLKGKRDAFDDAVSAFCANYEEMRSSQEACIKAALREVLEDDAKVEKVWSRIESVYPSARELIGKFSLGWSIYTLQSVNPKLAQAIGEETAPVRSILQGIVEWLRGDVQEKLGAVMELVTRGGKYTAKTTNAAIAVLDRVDALNIIGDSTLKAQTERIRQLLKTMNDEVSQEQKERFVTGLSDVQKILSEDMETAIKEAEANLTGFGQRKFAMEDAA